MAKMFANFKILQSFVTLAPEKNVLDAIERPQTGNLPLDFCPLSHELKCPLAQAVVTVRMNPHVFSLIIEHFE